MKPVFALNLSHEGIVLLHRSPRGAWTEVGDVALDDPNFGENLSFLRSTAVGLEGKGFGTKLIIPPSQVLCREIHAPGPGENERRAQILTALEGKTPYEVDDLTFDWTGNGPIVEVAVVWNETLDEAEEFAVEHRFNPISFVGDARDHPDGWEPFFGRTDFSHAFLGADADVRDTPEPDRGAPPDESLFIAPVASEEAADPAPDAPDSNNMFADVADNDETANIFADGAEPQLEADEMPPKDTGNEASAPTPMGEFTSRRDHSINPNDDDDHPVSRITPRIAITPEPTVEPSPPPAPQSTPASSESETGIIAGERLRDSFLAEESDARSLVAKIATVAPLLMTGALKLGGVARAALRRLRPNPSAQDASNAANVPDEHATDAPTKTRKIRRLAFIAVGILAIVALTSLVYTMRGSKDGQDQIGAMDDAAGLPITRAAARGVRADNRAAPRPNDFETVVAAFQGSKATSSPEALAVIRPQRRSIFEEKTDPQAGLADTATPVTALTERELADILAAGLEPPTQEELAEYGTDGQTNTTRGKDIAAAYAATGALQHIRKLPNPLAKPERDDIFVAGIDRALTAGDAIVLPDFSAGPMDDQPRKRLSPLDPNVVFDLDGKGLVKPTKEGALSPRGILVYAGKPVTTPPEKPETEALVPPDPLAALKPNARPAGLKTGEDAIFVQGRMTLARLRVKRAKPRPVSIQTELATAGDATPSELAVLTSFQPAKRPSDFSETVRKARVKIASATPATAPIVNSGPVLPIRASVAKNATIKNAINLSQISLIGIYGTEAKRRALLRLPTGRFVKVKKGDRLAGGQIAAIGIDSLRYVKGGRNRLLKMPKE